ncbi:MAG: hypothetical protein AAFV77_05385 [Planctomycetota bacterium]
MSSGGIEYDPEQDDAGSVSYAASVLARHEDALLRIAGVQGCMIAPDASGEEAILVLLRNASAKDQIPAEIDGVQVRTRVSGAIEAQ